MNNKKNKTLQMPRPEKAPNQNHAKRKHIQSLWQNPYRLPSDKFSPTFVPNLKALSTKITHIIKTEKRKDAV